MKLFLGVMPLQIQHADSAALLPPPQLPQTGLRYHKVATREIDAAVSPLAPRSAWGAGLRGVDIDCEWGRSPYPVSSAGRGKPARMLFRGSGCGCKQGLCKSVKAQSLWLPRPGGGIRLHVASTRAKAASKTGERSFSWSCTVHGTSAHL